MASYITMVLMFLAVYVAYHIYQIPIPEGATQQIRHRILFCLYSFLGKISSWLALTGMTTEVRAKNALLNAGTRMLRLADKGVISRDTVIDGVAARIYSPRGAGSDLPGMVYYHGGGFTVGNLDLDHDTTQMFAKEGNMVVISVDYRLSPDHPRKDGLDDCLRVTKYFINHAKDFSVDSSRIVLAGESAGAILAATISLYLRDNKFTPMPKVQLLIYPAVQIFDLQLPSHQQNVKGPLMDRHELMWFFSHIYGKGTEFVDSFNQNKHVPNDVRQKMAADLVSIDKLPRELLYPPFKRVSSTKELDPALWKAVKEDCFDPYLWPLMAQSHSNLPQAYIFTAQYDPIRDDGYLYADKLRDAGVKVSHYNCPHGWHGMVSFTAFFADSRKVVRDMIAYLKEEL